ncbi:MAG: imidazole glycerol phosphate synthase subunit HisH [Oscillospiraceae bacterium]|nr:imidazole glycerol phosphate synthase subunit HisH [Oscillospiraceae bacterium]
MIAIVDYGVGNLFSLRSSLASLGEEAVVTGNSEQLRSADRIILPGVGAFGDAADKLRSTGLDRTVVELVEEGKPLLGICLGMQLLFDRGYEFGEHAGLGLLRGEIVPMQGSIPEQLKIPQIGWNALIRKRDHFLLKDVHEGDCVYFVHSFYAANCEESLVATTEYGIEMTAVVAKDNVMGCQFHPEKSGKVGLSILSAFARGAV